MDQIPWFNFAKLWKKISEELTNIKKRLFFILKNSSNRKIFKWWIHDNCDLNEKFRWVGHCISNVRYSIQREISVILQNESNYDFHLIVEHLAEEFPNSDFKCSISVVLSFWNLLITDGLSINFYWKPLPNLLKQVKKWWQSSRENGEIKRATTKKQLYLYKHKYRIMKL